MSGGAHPEGARLAPSDLAARLDRILAAGQRLIASVPGPALRYSRPPGGRTVRDHAFGMFRLGLAFADAMDMGGFREEWRRERAPDSLDDGSAIARYGGLVRGRLEGWFEGAGPGEYARTIEGYGAAMSGRELLELTTASAARQLRELHSMLAEQGLLSGEPLPAADLDGLPSTEERR